MRTKHKAALFAMGATIALLVGANSATADPAENGPIAQRWGDTLVLTDKRETAPGIFIWTVVTGPCIHHTEMPRHRLAKMVLGEVKFYLVKKDAPRIGMLLLFSNDRTYSEGWAAFEGDDVGCLATVAERLEGVSS